VAPTTSIVASRSRAVANTVSTTSVPYRTSVAASGNVSRNASNASVAIALLDGRLVGNAAALLDDVDDRHPVGGVRFERPRAVAGVIGVRDGDECVTEETHAVTPPP